MVADGMFVVGMGQGTNQRPFVTLSGEHGQMFADLKSRCASRNRCELAADVVGSVRFRVEAVMLGEAPRQEDKNDRFVRARRIRGRFFRTGSQACHVIHSQAKQADAASLNGCPPVDRVVRRPGVWNALITGTHF